MAGRTETRNNIMSQLLHASEQSENSASDKNSQKALSDEEMMGNLFVFTGAGFDTTVCILKPYASLVSFVMFLGCVRA